MATNRTSQIRVICTPEEHAAVQKIAEQNRQSMSAWVLSLIFKKIKSSTVNADKKNPD